MRMRNGHASTRSRRTIAVLLVAGAVGSGATALTTRAASTVGTSVPADSAITLPPGYRDWKLISVAHEAGNLNDLRAILGNDAAVRAFRAGTLPLPDGAIIARVAWAYAPSAENDKAFGRQQSFVAGAPTNVQLMVKDSRKYAAMGGWGYAQFSKGNPANEAVAKTCHACHVPASAHDYVFTRYAP